MRQMIRMLWKNHRMKFVTACVALACLLGTLIAVPALHRHQENERGQVVVNTEDGGLLAELEDNSTDAEQEDKRQENAEEAPPEKETASDDAPVAEPQIPAKPVAASQMEQIQASSQKVAETTGNSQPGADAGKDDSKDTGNKKPGDRKEYCLVKFVTNSGGSITDKKYRKNAAFGKLPTANKLDHIFCGWYYDEGLKKPVADGDLVQEDMTLYAKYEETPQPGFAESPVALVKTDVEKDFTIALSSTDDLSADAVEHMVSVKNLSTPDADSPMKVAKTGEGSYLLSFTDDGFDGGASYKAVLADKSLCFADSADATREFDFTARAEEVLNTRYNSDVQYLSSSDFKNITINGEPVEDFSIGLFAVDKHGDPAKVAAKTGTFETTAAVYKVGDIVALYDGVRPDLRTLEGDSGKYGDVAYVEITACEPGTNTYSFKQAEAEDVIFRPDMLPVSSQADQVPGDGNRLTVSKDDLDFSADVYANIGLDSQTVVDQGDFIVFYEGSDFGSLATSGSIVSYAEITEVKLDGDLYIIDYKSVDWDYVQKAMDVYSKGEVDLSETVTEEQKKTIVASVKKQAMESGFAEEAAMYLASLALATDGFKELTADVDLSDYRITLEDGTPLDPSEVRLMADGAKVEISDTKVKADFSNQLKEFEGVDGIRLTLSVTTKITIHVNDKIDIEIEITGDFVQEVKLGLGLKANAVWKVWGIIPYIADYVVNADVDIYEYTGIGIRADVSTAEPDDDDDKDGDDKKDDDKDKDGKKTLADQIKDLMDKYEQEKKDAGLEDLKVELEIKDEEEEEDDEVSISTALKDKYKAMLENDTDWVDLVSVEIFKTEQMLVPVLPIVAVEVEADFVVQLNANVSIGMDFYYKNAKRYCYTFSLGKRTVQNEVINLCEEQYEFDFYIVGVLGVRAGIKLELGIGLFSTDLDSVSFTVEAGAYVKLYGYFYYNLSYTESKGRSQMFSGAMYLEIGCYLEIGLEAQALKGTFKLKDVSLYENEWPLFGVGARRNIQDFAIQQDDVPEIKLSQNIREAILPDEMFEMAYMDMVEGEEGTEICDDTPGICFKIIFTDDRFSYDSETNKIKVEPREGDALLEADMNIIWLGGPLAFCSAPIKRTIHIKWTNLRDGYVIVPNTNGGSYAPIITAAYNEPVKAPADPVKKGYVFGGWYQDEKLTMPYTFPEKMSNVDTEIYAKWTEATDTPYRVRYYLQKLESDEYTLDKTIDSVGTTNSIVKPMPDAYVGYTTPAAEELIIQADGTAVLNYYYNRVIRYVTFAPGAAGGEEDVYEFKYGATVRAPRFAACGYIFKGWDKEIAPVMGAENVTYTALWDKAKDTDYRIEYYVQNTAGNYKLVDTVFGKEETGKEFTCEELRKDDIYAKENEIEFASVTVLGEDLAAAGKNAVVGADGKTVIKVNYSRKKLNITFKLGGVLDDLVEAYYINQMIEPPKVSSEGYLFLGWFLDEEFTEAVPEGMDATAEINIYAKWEEKARIMVKHYVMRTDGTYSDTATRTDRVETVKGEVTEVAGLIAKDLLVENGIVYARTVNEAMEPITEVTAKAGANNIAIYYERKQYALAWELNGGKAANSYSEDGDYYYGQLIVAPVPVRRGYTYEWEIVPAAEMPIGDVTYRVVWTETDRSEVRFVDYDNTEIAKFRGIPGDALEALVDDPVRAGYEFVGWDNVIPEVYGEDNLVLRAQYEIRNYRLAYELNGGALKDGDAFVNSYTIESEKIPLVTPIRKGYAFSGWYEDAAFSSEPVTEVAKGSTGDRTFYARWTPNTYTIEFKGSDADNRSDTMESLSMTYGEKLALTKNIYTKDGWKFVGWATAENSKFVRYKDEAAVENLTAENGGTVTLYAVFIEGYCILYENLGDAEMSEDAAVFFAEGDPNITLESPALNKTGYTFAGWYTDDSFADNTKLETVNTSSKQDVIIYAKWTPNVYSVTFDANLKSGSGEYSQMMTYDTPVKLDPFSGMAFVNPGYSFRGWTREQNSKNVDYADNAQVCNLAASGNIRLYAVWDVIEYSITYQDVKMGAAGHTNPGVYRITDNDIRLKAPADVKSGFEFLGWFDASTGERVEIIQQGSYGNRVLTAKWATAGVFSLTYNRTENGTAVYRIVRTIADGTVPTESVQNVYYRTENGTAVGGTHFTHVGGNECYVSFDKNDGNGSYKEFKVSGENPNKEFTPNGGAMYVAGALSSSAAQDKFYYVRIYDVKTNNGSCRGSVSADSAQYKRNIGKGTVLDRNSIYNKYFFYDGHYSTTKKVITDKGFDSNWSFSYRLNTDFLSTFLQKDYPNVDAKILRYIDETTKYYNYYFTASVSEDYDGYQYIRYSLGEGNAIDSRLQYQFEIKSGKKYTDYEYHITFPADITQGVVTPFVYNGGWGDGLQRIGTGKNSALKVENMRGNLLNMQFDGSGDGKDDWDIKDIWEYLKIAEGKEAAQVSIAPMAMGEYKAGSTVEIAVVYDSIIHGFTIGNATACLKEAQIPVSTVSVRNSSADLGNNVIVFEVVLSSDLNVDGNFNQNLANFSGRNFGTVRTIADTGM